MKNFKMPFFGSHHAVVKILTHISETQLKEGRYELSISVTRSKDLAAVKQKREEENYVALPCIGGACSGEIELPLDGKKCPVKYTVTGALQELFPQEDGVLEYNDSLVDNTMILHLKPTDDASNGEAAIKFYVNQAPKHTVAIHDVQIKAPACRSNSCSFAFGSDDIDSFTEMKIVEEDCVVREAPVAYSGQSVISADVQAVPVSPRSGVAMVPSDSWMSVSGDENSVQGAVGGSMSYHKILTDSSLHSLAWAISPTNHTSVLTRLKVPNQVIEHKIRDNPGHIVEAVYKCFIYWRSERMQDEESQDMDHTLYEELIKVLEDVGRRDIKIKLQKALSKDEELSEKDFKQ